MRLSLCRHIDLINLSNVNIVINDVACAFALAILLHQLHNLRKNCFLARGRIALRIELASAFGIFTLYLKRGQTRLIHALATSPALDLILLALFLASQFGFVFIFLHLDSHSPKTSILIRLSGSSSLWKDAGFASIQVVTAGLTRILFCSRLTSPEDASTYDDSEPKSFSDICI